MASGGGGGSWINGLVGGIGAGAGVRGYNNQVNSSNKYYNQVYSPANVNAYAQQFNPWIWDAIAGKQGNTQFTKDLYNILQGIDISPYLLNKPVNQINQGANQNLARFQSLVGRNNSGGGLANAYGLANLGNRTNSLANLYNQYGQWKEQQRRADINWGLGQVGESQTRGQAAVDRIAGSHQFKKNFWQKLAAFGAGYAGATGGGGSPTAPTNQTAYMGPGTQDSFGNIPNANNSMMGYQDTVAYPYQGGSSLPTAGTSNWLNPYQSNSSIQTGGSTPNWYRWK